MRSPYSDDFQSHTENLSLIFFCVSQIQYFFQEKKKLGAPKKKSFYVIFLYYIMLYNYKFNLFNKTEFKRFFQYNYIY